MCTGCRNRPNLELRATSHWQGALFGPDKGKGRSGNPEAPFKAHACSCRPLGLILEENLQRELHGPSVTRQNFVELVEYAVLRFQRVSRRTGDAKNTADVVHGASDKLWVVQ